MIICNCSEGIVKSLREMSPNTDIFSGPYFPLFSPNAGKCGPEKTSYLDTFHTENLLKTIVSQ